MAWYPKGLDFVRFVEQAFPGVVGKEARNRAVSSVLGNNQVNAEKVIGHLAEDPGVLRLLGSQSRGPLYDLQVVGQPQRPIPRMLAERMGFNVMEHPEGTLSTEQLRTMASKAGKSSTRFKGVAPFLGGGLYEPE